MPTSLGAAASDVKIPFDEVCARLDLALQDTFRHDIIRDALHGVTTSVPPCCASVTGSVRTSGKSRRGCVWTGEGLHSYDSRTRADGFHALHDWDGIADSVNDETIRLDVLHYIADKAGLQPPNHRCLAIPPRLLLHVPACAPVAAYLGRGRCGCQSRSLGRAARDLQGPHGSGQQFAHDAETLILIATSHFELDEHGYDLLLERTRTLNHAHQTRIAIGHAPCLGSHLRFGFEATYGRDTVNMRNDNVADYPWLCFSISTLMHEYGRMREAGITGVARNTIVEAMLNGLTPDARALVGSAPSFLSAWEAELAAFREGFRRYADDLLAGFEPFRPTPDRYSPLSFFFNFSHNVLKGTVVDALLAGEPWALTINDLATGIDHDGGANAQAKERLARTLMGMRPRQPSQNSWQADAGDRLRSAGWAAGVLGHDAQALGVKLGPRVDGETFGGKKRHRMTRAASGSLTAANQRSSLRTHRHATSLRRSLFRRRYRRA